MQINWYQRNNSTSNSKTISIKSMQDKNENTKA